MNEQQQTAHVPAPLILVLTSLEERRKKCSWCWEKRNPGKPYPREYSSTICPECEAVIDAQRAQVKAERSARRRGPCFS
jgi:hypothetical protein